MFHLVNIFLSSFYLYVGKKTVELLRSMLAKLSSGIEDLKDKEALEDSKTDRNTGKCRINVEISILLFRSLFSLL